MKKAEQTHLHKIKSLPCVVCGHPPPSAAHHCLTGMGRKKNHFKVIPLCWSHHQGINGIHTIGKRLWQSMYCTEAELLEHNEIHSHPHLRSVRTQTH